ncbi:MAG: hypothetical protein HYU51_17005 [Candidatus Rokubacteria bacterium]|nr:hypothetical protein [Candidatus Rokubacteria bacterium]
MPSDDRTRDVLSTLRPATEAFLGSIATTADEVRRWLAAQQSNVEGRAAALRAELGPFGARHLDADRLVAIVDRMPHADPATLEAVEHAREVLGELFARGAGLFTVRLGDGEDLCDAVAAALAEVGRAFASARVAQDARAGRRPGAHGAAALERLPFARWSRSERRLAPPLVVQVDGADLRAAGLSEFLDGRQKLVLVVRGDCAPAPLVRLITPGTFVAQTGDLAALDGLVRFDGPGVAAVVPETAARFLHDPASGGASWERITIIAVPDTPPRKTIGGFSPVQQAEELALLSSLAAPPRSAVAAAEASAQATSSDPVDRLASWLLRQADLANIR